MLFDEKATMITKDALLKTLCWYDNGWGFSKRILFVPALIRFYVVSNSSSTPTVTIAV